MAGLTIKCSFQSVSYVSYDFILPNGNGEKLVESRHLINIEKNTIG